MGVLENHTQRLTHFIKLKIMENLVILTKQNINDYQLTESFCNDVLVYDDENLINAYSRFEFAINADTKQLYSRHIILGRVKEWKEYTIAISN